jgi:hypothetical protein
MVQYYTLDEAARVLGISPDELKTMARRGELRPFQDRGTLRFRSPEIDELARRRGMGSSDPELQYGEALAPKPADSPAPKRPPDDEEVALGQEPPAGPTSSKKGSGSGKKSPKPVAKSGSDSDVRLVADGSNLDIQVDSDVRMVEDAPAPKSAARKATPKPAQGDSGVRLVSPEAQSDSDVKIVGDTDDNAVALGQNPAKTPSDSDIRLEKSAGQTSKPASDKKKKDSVLTEEIDLDAEMRKAEEAKAKKGSSDKHRPIAAQTTAPATSPFELSESELKIPPKETKKQTTESSDDFDLTPTAERDQSPLELGSDEEIALQPPEERTLMTPQSGIDLPDPAPGIPLEHGGSTEEVEFDLSKDQSSTPKPSSAKGPTDSSGEFELSLDRSSGEVPDSGEDSSSEFELSLEDSGAQPASDVDSDSEFELTLDTSGGLVPLESEGAAEGVEAEKDIFESDLDEPGLEEESGSEAMALEESDTDLESSSDFDLALGEEDVVADEASGSQVVALEDEEEAEAGAATVMRPRPRLAGGTAEEVGEFDELDLEGEPEALIDEEGELVAGRAPAAAPPAKWGAFPAIAMIPCVILMFLVCLMSWEMMTIMWGYHQDQKVTGIIAPWMARTFLGDDAVPKD